MLNLVVIRSPSVEPVWRFSVVKQELIFFIVWTAWFLISPWGYSVLIKNIVGLPYEMSADCFSLFILLQGNENGLTLISDNPFINKKELGPFEKGIRIDYILFKVGGRTLRLPLSLRFNPFILILSGFQSRHLGSELRLASWGAFSFLLYPGFVESRHLLRFHVHHQRLRRQPPLPVFRSRSSDVWAAAHSAHSEWGRVWQQAGRSAVCHR